jgi:hypothetical protein
LLHRQAVALSPLGEAVVTLVHDGPDATLQECERDGRASDAAANDCDHWPVCRGLRQFASDEPTGSAMLAWGSPQARTLRHWIAGSFGRSDSVPKLAKLLVGWPHPPPAVSTADLALAHGRKKWPSSSHHITGDAISPDCEESHNGSLLLPSLSQFPAVARPAHAQAQH